MVTLDTSVLADLFLPVKEERKIEEHDRVVERLREL